MREKREVACVRRKKEESFDYGDKMVVEVC